MQLASCREHTMHSACSVRGSVVRSLIFKCIFARFKIRMSVLKATAVTCCINATLLHSLCCFSVVSYMWQCVSRRKILRIRSWHRHRQLMRRLEKVEGRRGPGPAAAAAGGVGKCGAWSQSLCRAAGCGYLLLCSAEREEPKTSWKGANLLVPSSSVPASRSPPPIFHPAFHLCPSLPRAWLKSGGGQQASCRLQLGPGLACSAGRPCLWPELLSYLVISRGSGLRVLASVTKTKENH